MKDPIFISFYTPNGNYPTLAQQLADSLKQFSLEYQIEEVAPFNNWAESICFKPTFILQRLLDARRPVIFLDADTELKQYPHLLMQEHDFAILNWLAITNHRLSNVMPYDPNAKQLVCAGGVQKWGYTAPAIELLVRWINQVNHNPTALDDPNLDAIYNHHQPPVNYLWLPKTYNQMTNQWEHTEPSVILHHYQDGAHRDPKTPNTTTQKTA